MSKRRTSKPRRRPNTSVLQVRVMSPRIAWLGFLKGMVNLGKVALVLAVLGLIGWGGWYGIKRAFFENPDFRLQVIDLNKNAAIDEFALIEITGIDLSASIFKLDTDEITERLRKVPALSTVNVERRLPGTLAVRVIARTPRAWIACPEAGIPAVRKTGGLLVDESAAVFPCTTLQFEEAKDLPFIILPQKDGFPIVAGQPIRHKELQRCFTLLDAARASDREAPHSIESISQANDWSLVLTTREGVKATFGLGDHARQIANFRSAVDHFNRNGETIDTINLIPKENVPVKIRHEASPPRAVPVPEPTAEDISRERRQRDLQNLLNSR